MSGWLNKMWSGFSVAMVLGTVLLAILLDGLIPCWQSWRSASWLEVPCVILESGSAPVWSRRQTVPQFRFAVRFTYEANGRSHQSTRYSFFNLRSSATTTHDLTLRFAAGTRTACRVNPGNPAEAVLDPAVQGKALLMPAVLLGVGGLLGLLVGLKRLARRTFT